MNREQKMNHLLFHRKEIGLTLIIVVLAILMARPIWREPVVGVAGATAALPDLQGAAALHHLREQGLYASLGAAVAAARRTVRSEQIKHAVTYFADNPEQQLRARFTAHGAEVEPQQGATWRLGLRLRGYGYPGQMRATTPGTIRATGQRVELHHQVAPSDKTTSITEWYENGAEGLEHGFTVGELAERRLAAQPLRVALEVSGDLAATLDADGQAVTLRGAGGTALRYDHLAVYDALGHQLAARMELRGSELSFVVEDESAIYPLTIDPVLGQQQKLVAPDLTDGALMGAAVAISGNTAVVGVPERTYYDSFAGMYSGDVNIFVRSGSYWSLHQTIRNPTIPMFVHPLWRNFGATVAISGDTLLIGAPKTLGTPANCTASPSGGNCEESGRVAVYVRANEQWGFQASLYPDNYQMRAYDQFGHSVALDGNTALIGAWQDDVGGNADQGSAYVFVRSGDTWTQQQMLTGLGGAAGDRFGQSVALSGNTALIGAHNDDYGGEANRGTASVFVRSGTTWTLQTTLTTLDGDPDDEFGCAVALSGNTALIGARFDDIGTATNRGSAYVYTRSGTQWTQQQKLTSTDGASYDLFGISVALSGNTALVGAYSADVAGKSDQGAAYVFDRSGTTWTQTKKLLAADGLAADKFGTAVALDGASALVGATGVMSGGLRTGAAYVFYCAPLTFSPTALPAGRVGTSYSQTIQANGGTAPYTYAFTGGTMPPGLTLSAGGVLSGTPTTVGNYYLYVQATDANGCTGATSYPLTIRPACTTISVIPVTVPAGTRNVAYSQQLTASGGVAPYSFSLTGTLPPGMMLSNSGQLVGTPTAAGRFTFKAKATDANGCFGLRQYTLVIN